MPSSSRHVMRARALFCPACMYIYMCIHAQLLYRHKQPRAIASDGVASGRRGAYIYIYTSADRYGSFLIFRARNARLRPARGLCAALEKLDRGLVELRILRNSHCSQTLSYAYSLVMYNIITRILISRRDKLFSFPSRVQVFL